MLSMLVVTDRPIDQQSSFTSEGEHSSEAIDAIRLRHGFMPVGELLELTKTGNSVLDPYSTLVAQGVRIGRDNVIYPGVTILCDCVSACVLGGAGTPCGLPL
ncbi:hypothetical protein ACFV6G_01340 [Streptomyces lavendulae]|uniref:hypothetical protein n=1 Tax=Streptomyces lavendulae TaxID=1914 RepID=UPI00368AE8CB